MNQVKKSDYAYKKFKKDLNYTFSLSGSVSLVVLALYALSALFLYLFNSYNLSSIWSFLLIFIFIMIVVGILSPFLYSFFANNAILEGPDREKVGIKSLFKTAKFGFFPPYKGLLNTWLTLLVSIIIFLVSTTVVDTLILTILYYTNGTYNEFFNSLVGVSDYNALLEAISSHGELFFVPSMISTLVSLCLSIFFYLRNILINIFKYSIAGLFLGIPRRALNFIFKDTIKKHKKEFLKGFYSHAWIILVVFFACLIGSYIGLYFTFSNLSEKNYSSFIMIISITSVVIALIISLIFYPILFNHYLDIFNVYRNYFVNNFVSIMSSEIKQAKEMENNEEFNSQIKIAEDKLDDFKKKMGAQDDSSSKDIDSTDEDIVDKKDDNEVKEEKKDDENKQ